MKSIKALFVFLFMILTVSSALAEALPKPAPVGESKSEVTAIAEVKFETDAKAEHVESEPTTPSIVLPADSPKSVSFADEKNNKPKIKTIDNYVAIFDFEVRDKDKDISRPLTDRVIHVFSKSNKYEVIDRGNMNKILEEQKFQMSGCVAQECRVEAGQILGVGKIVTGSVGVVGKTYYLMLQLIDVKTGKVELSAEDVCKCEIDDLLDSTMKLAKKILGEKVEQSAETNLKTAIAAIDPAIVSLKIVARDGRFEKLSSGVVRDTKSGLEWYVGPDKNTDWESAKSWTANLRVDGGGWRMPTVTELKGLYQKGVGSRNMTMLLETTGWWVWSGKTGGKAIGTSAVSLDFSDGKELSDSDWPTGASYYKRGFAVRSR